MTWLKKYGIALAILLAIIALVTWAVVGQLSKPERAPVRIDPKPAEVIEKEITAEPDAEKSVETNVPKEKAPE